MIAKGGVYYDPETGGLKFNPHRKRPLDPLPEERAAQLAADLDFAGAWGIGPGVLLHGTIQQEERAAFMAKAEGEVQAPGSRGGKFYVSPKGMVRYGAKPMGRPMAKPKPTGPRHERRPMQLQAKKQARKIERHRARPGKPAVPTKAVQRKAPTKQAPQTEPDHGPAPAETAKTPDRARAHAEAAVPKFKQHYERLRLRAMKLVSAAKSAKLVMFRTALKVGDTWRRFEHYCHKRGLHAEELVLHAFIEFPHLAHLAHSMLEPARAMADMVLKAEQLDLFGERHAVQAPGSRGGRWRFDKAFNIRYDKPPPPKMPPGWVEVGGRWYPPPKPEPPKPPAPPMGDLYARIAAALGWTEKDTRSFSLLTLRDLVRKTDPALAEEMSVVNRSGAVLIGEPLREPTPVIVYGEGKRTAPYKVESYEGRQPATDKATGNRRVDLLDAAVGVSRGWQVVSENGGFVQVARAGVLDIANPTVTVRREQLLEPDEEVEPERVEKFREQAAAEREVSAAAVSVPTPDIKRAEKFRKLALGMQDGIDRRREPSTQNPTRKRMQDWASAAKEADRLERLQSMLIELASRAEKGTLEPELANVTHRTDIELILRSRWGAPGQHSQRENLRFLVEGHARPSMEKSPGTKADRDIVRRALLSEGAVVERDCMSCDGTGTTEYGRDCDRCGKTGRTHDRSEHLVPLSDEAWEAVGRMLAAGGEPWKHLDWVPEDFAGWKGAKRLGLSTQAEWDKARRLLKSMAKDVGRSSKEIEIFQKESALIGTKIPGFFPTPDALSDRLVSVAELQPGMRVLEPSAGKGNIVEALRRAGVAEDQLDVGEFSSSLREILELKGAHLVADDFLAYNPGPVYDRIIQNPPFENGADVEHVRHAFELLKPGGRLVSIMGEHPFFATDKRSADFRAWLDDQGSYGEKLPEKSFMSSSRPTGVNCRIIVLDKPAAGMLAKAAASVLQLLAKADQLSLFGDRKPVMAPGSRGGKWWRDDQGNVRYGERPAPEQPASIAESLAEAGRSNQARLDRAGAAVAELPAGTRVGRWVKQPDTPGVPGHWSDGRRTVLDAGLLVETGAARLVPLIGHEALGMVEPVGPEGESAHQELKRLREQWHAEGAAIDAANAADRADEAAAAAPPEEPPPPPEEPPAPPPGGDGGDPTDPDEPPPEEPREHWLGPGGMAWMDERVSALAKRARRIGVVEPAIKVLAKEMRREARYWIDQLGEFRFSPHSNTWLRPDETAHPPYRLTGQVREYTHIEVTAPEVKLAGWKFLGRIEHEGGDNLIQNVPGEHIPNEYRDAGPKCDHCKTERRRNDTFVLQHDDGSFKQVGRDCIKDFLGHADAERLANAAELYGDLGFLLGAAGERDEEGDEEGGGGSEYADLEVFLAHAALSIRLRGFVSRKMNQEGDDRTPTAMDATQLMFPPKSKRAEWPKPEPQDQEMAKKVLAWVEGLSDADIGGSDYLYNLSALARRGAIRVSGGKTHTGLAASMQTAYQRATDQLKERERKVNTSEHVGTVGERQVIEGLTIDKIIAREGDYGVTYIHKMHDAAGNEYTWFGSKHLKVPKAADDMTANYDYDLREGYTEELASSGGDRGIQATIAPDGTRTEWPGHPPTKPGGYYYPVEGKPRPDDATLAADYAAWEAKYVAFQDALNAGRVYLRDAGEGDTLDVKATIKNHEVYRDVKQTVITRVSELTTDDRVKMRKAAERAEKKAAKEAAKAAKAAKSTLTKSVREWGEGIMRYARRLFTKGVKPKADAPKADDDGVRYVTIHKAGPETPGEQVRMVPDKYNPGIFDVHEEDKDRAKGAFRSNGTPMAQGKPAGGASGGFEGPEDRRKKRARLIAKLVEELVVGESGEIRMKGKGR